MRQDMYDHLPALEAALQAWTTPGGIMTDPCWWCPFVGCGHCPIKKPPKARHRAGETRAQEK